MQQMLEFEYENSRPFRVIDRDGEPWFVLSDVCRELEIGNAAHAASRLDDDEKGIINSDTLRGVQKVIIINEFRSLQPDPYEPQGGGEAL